MSIFGALSASVEGLRAQAAALENISGNIANSQTVGYKRTDTSFADLVPEATAGQATAGSVLARANLTNAVQGQIQSASQSTDMAINGAGYFIVEKPTGVSNGVPTFDGNVVYTRRGDFSPDANGYLVNGSGYYLLGTSVDPTSGNLVGGNPQILNVQKTLTAAQGTTEIDYKVNLPSSPLTASHSDTAGSDLFTAASATVSGDDAADFVAHSISGGTVTAYDQTGNPVTIQLRWAKVDSAASGGTDKWNLYVETDSTATGTATAWTNTGTDYTFGSDGKLVTDVPNVALSNVTIDGTNLGAINLVHGSNGVTQFADTTGAAKVATLSQNGFSAGELTSVGVGDNGRLVGHYSNGRDVDMAEITLADFNNPNGLTPLDGEAFAASENSGTAILGANGQVVGGSLESSNVDIADEFSKLIVTQQAYSANAKVITTANQMADETINMLR